MTSEKYSPSLQSSSHDPKTHSAIPPPVDTTMPECLPVLIGWMLVVYIICLPS